MKIKLRFWCPSQKKFVYEVRSWFLPNGELNVIGTKEEEIIPQLSTECFDKNRTIIYEGDKISYLGRIGTIEFFAGKFQLAYDDQTDSDLAYLSIDQMEIVGNIFEGVTKEVEPEPEEEEEELDLENCEQCDERAWDGYICHSCGAKNV